MRTSQATTVWLNYYRWRRWWRQNWLYAIVAVAASIIVGVAVAELAE